MRVKQAFSVRLWVAAIIVGGVAAALTSLIGVPALTAVVFFGVTGGVAAMLIVSDDAGLYCPHCLKRLKAGAATCHHCGRDARRTHA